jgi:hypothetical protein
MGIFDIFSGEKGRNTAIWSAANTSQGANVQRDYLNTGAEQSLAALGQGNQTARTELGQGYNAGMLGYGNSTLNAIQNQQQTTGIADSYLSGLGAEANRGYSAYGDAAGVNGAEGQARARSNFQTGPGYQFGVNEAVNAATRGANAAGMAASGNTVDATTRLGSNLANQEWGSYVSRLNPYLDKATQIAGRRGDYQQHLGDQYSQMMSQYGRDYGNAAIGQGQQLAALGSGLGTSQAGIYSDLSKNLSNVTGSEYAALTGQGQAGLLAGQTANANTWNAGMGIANLVADNASKASSLFK